MQAKLPDVNARLVHHMNAAQQAYDIKDFSKAAINFEASIALLPEDYRPEINTLKYNETVKEKLNIICNSCKTETKRSEIIPYRVLLVGVENLVSGRQIQDVWKCPKCEVICPLASSPTKLILFEKPTYFKIIPEPPAREGFHDRVGFEAKFKKWYDITCREIEHQIGLYRTEYASQQDGVMEVLPDE